jgi:hypothetical protein
LAGRILQLPKLENGRSDLVGELLLLAGEPIPFITSPRSRLRVVNSPAKTSFAFCCRSAAFPVMTSATAFSASVSGVRRAASRVTRSLMAGSASQAAPTSSMGGPDQTAAIEMSGTFI